MGGPYRFAGGFPATDTVARVYDELDFNRAVAAYRFFYPTVSLEATWRGNLAGGAVPNQVFPLLEGMPEQYVFTANSDTPYSGLMLDLSAGPLVIELPPGPLMGAVNDLNQLWVCDVGIPGPAGPHGGRHLLLPPDDDVTLPPPEHFVARPTTDRVLALVRALPQQGDVAGAMALMRQVRVYPLEPAGDVPEPEWIDLTGQQDLDFTPRRWERDLEFWRVLHEILAGEVPNPAYRYHYGELAALGIERGVPFAPDPRMRAILIDAAHTGHAQMCVQAFADRRADRTVWPGTLWEWAVLRPENGTFDTDYYTDLYAREKWFYQAQIESPAMFRRSPGTGSLYWLGLRDSTGAYLEGAGYYTLTVPQPVPAGMFWSVTVYDAVTRSEIRTGQETAALRSMVELADADPAVPLTLFFGPTPPRDGPPGRWIGTLPGIGWFAYFRIYGPGAAAFDHTWQLPDFRRH